MIIKNLIKFVEFCKDQVNPKLNILICINPLIENPIVCCLEGHESIYKVEINHKEINNYFDSYALLHCVVLEVLKNESFSLLPNKLDYSKYGFLDISVGRDLDDYKVFLQNFCNSEYAPDNLMFNHFSDMPDTFYDINAQVLSITDGYFENSTCNSITEQFFDFYTLLNLYGIL